MGSLKQYKFVDYATQSYTALVLVLVVLFHNHTVPRWQWIAAAHVGILLVAHLFIQAHAFVGRVLNPSPCVRRAGKVIEFLRHFYPVLLYTWFFTETGSLNRMFFKEFMDPMLIRWEQALFHSQPSVSFMASLPYLAVSEIFYASYFSYYVMIAGIGIALFVRERRHFYHYVSVISFVFYICYATYVVLPIIGPRVFFYDLGGFVLSPELQQLAFTHTYPAAVETGVFYQIMAFIYQTFEAPGAAFPSSHVAIALTTVWFSFRYLPRIRYLHLFVAILLCLSTVYCRYHYVIDVFAGIATAAVLVPIAHWLYRKTEPGSAEPAPNPRPRDCCVGHTRAPVS